MSLVQMERQRDTPRTGLSFEQDYRERLEPALMTALIHEAVPLTRHAAFRFVDVREGFSSGELPLAAQNTNQHGTHQSMLIGMLGDYVGGLALASLLRGVPIAGIHPVFDDSAMALWLVSSDIRFLEPSCDALVARCSVPEGAWSEIRQRYFSGAAQSIPLEVDYHDTSGTRVATATMTYYLRPAACLRPDAPGRSGGTMFRHQLKASARLIANLRGRSLPGLDGPAEAPWSLALAGLHGQLLGDRALALLPQVGAMVAARTRHADAFVLSAHAAGVRQLVLLGAGLDTRPFRLASRLPGMRVFELDLAEMLRVRERALSRLSLPHVERHALSINLDFDDPRSCLERHPAFALQQPVCVVYEGCSMYFNQQRAQAIFSALGRLVACHADSRLWLDLVHSAVIGADGPPAVQSFVAGMAKLGEPFVFGHDDARTLLADYGLEVVHESSAGEEVDPTTDEVFALYRFVVARGAGKPVLAT